MKKTKKILAGLSAALIAVTCAVHASAMTDTPGFKPDKVIFSSVTYPENNPYYDRFEFWVDEDYNFARAHYSMTNAVVRIPDGSEPPYLKEGEFTVKLNKNQLAEIDSNRSWEAIYDLSVELTDNMYYIIGFRNPSDAEDYCERLLSEGIADFAKPAMYCEYGRGCLASEMLINEGINNGINWEECKFDEKRFIYYAVMENEDTAADFNAESVEGLKENISAIEVRNKKVYFQFNKDIDDETIINTLRAFEKNDKVIGIDSPNMATLSSVSEGGAVLSMPEIYEKGDVNRDYKVNIYDVISLAENLIGIRAFDDEQTILADFDDNNKVDLYDAIGIATAVIPADFDE